jgi:F-type H+-transporting ATPase subunit delta
VDSSSSTPSSERPRRRSTATSTSCTVVGRARRSRYVAQVRVAAPLDAAQEQRLQLALTRIYGREVQLQVDVDPTVVGGASVRVGDEVLDGTVARRLEAARRGLLR